MPNLAIQLFDINKNFGTVCANKNVSLTVKSGTIHGIVGENGAGKSTLMSVLYGFYQADSGSISVLEKQTARSEEHTSELQSLVNLVCRLLLEKKKNKLI